MADRGKADHVSIARAKMSASGRDRKFSPEHRAKLSAAAGKVAKANRGRKFTHEHRAKLSAAATARERRRRPRLLDGTVDALIDDIGADALDARLILSFASDTLEMAE
jgi:NUMOD3 motif